MRPYRVRRAAATQRDFDIIDSHLVESYQALLGEMPEAAQARAAERIDEALAYMRTFREAPHRGTEQSHIRPGLRMVSHANFVFHFEIDEEAGIVTILAVFFGRVNHARQILERLDV